MKRSEANRARDETGLDQVGPGTHLARDARGFRRVIEAQRDVERAEQALRVAVADARAAGDTWAVVGAALGVSRQAAYQRFGR